MPELLTAASEQRRSEARSELVRTATSLGLDTAGRGWTLVPDATYRVVLSSPTEGSLHLRPDGLYDAFVLGPQGRIESVARLQMPSPDFLAIAGFGAGQILLAKISLQLGRIERKIDRVLERLDIEQQGQIENALAKLENLRWHDTHRDRVLADAEMSLSNNLSMLIIELTKGLARLPDPSKFKINPFHDRSIRRELVDLRSRAGLLLLVLRAEAEAILLMAGHENMARILNHSLQQLSHLPFERAERLGRSLPSVDDSDREELFWRGLRESVSRAQERLADAESGEEPMRIEYSLKGHELLRMQAAPDVS